VLEARLSGLLELLVDPVDGSPLELDGDALVSAAGARYAVVRGIPRLVVARDDDQAQTSESFGYKWGRRDTYESDEWREVAREWLLRRYGFGDAAEMRAALSGTRLLDAGCGAGFSASLWLSEAWEGHYVGVDISSAVDVAAERLTFLPRADFVQADVLALPFGEGAFDAAIAEGVLHHTPSTAEALRALARAVCPGGKVLFYVYRRKGPVRELADDHVRAAVSSLPPEEAWAALRPLTRLGEALSALETDVEVPEDVPLLGIPAGRYPVQRLVYWHFAKIFWNERLSLEENTHVNFDWYHPRYAHRQSEQEVRDACARASLRIEHLDAQESGFTVVAVKS
jgi:arsenite methyltransferase